MSHAHFTHLEITYQASCPRAATRICAVARVSNPQPQVRNPGHWHWKRRPQLRKWHIISPDSWNFSRSKRNRPAYACSKKHHKATAAVVERGLHLRTQSLKALNWSLAMWERSWNEQWDKFKYSICTNQEIKDATDNIGNAINNTRASFIEAETVYVKEQRRKSVTICGYYSRNRRSDPWKYNKLHRREHMRNQHCHGKFRHCSFM